MALAGRCRGRPGAGDLIGGGGVPLYRRNTPVKNYRLEMNLRLFLTVWYSGTAVQRGPTKNNDTTRPRKRHRSRSFQVRKAKNGRAPGIDAPASLALAGQGPLPV